MLTIGDCVRHANSRFGEQNLARCSEVGYTYAEISDRCARVAAHQRSGNSATASNRSSRGRPATDQ